MPNAKEKAVDKIKRNLFRPKDDLIDALSQAEYERKKRIMLCVTKKMDDPIISDKELILFLTTGCGGVCKTITDSTAYRDLKLINDVTGNIKLASKSWLRYVVIETAKKEIRHWQGKDGKAVAALQKNIIQVALLNQNDKGSMLENMIPFEPIITDDPTVLGESVTPIKNLDERRKKLRYLTGKRDVQDIDFSEEHEETI